LEADVKAERTNVRLRATSLVAALIGAGAVIVYSSSPEHRHRYEEADIEKLARITRADHSTIFFHGYTKSGYVRNGQFHPLMALDVTASRAVRCQGRAHSRDGSRVAYVVPTEDQARCRIVVRDVETDTDRPLAEVAESWRPLSWSWDDSEIAYQRRDGIFAVSTRDGRERRVAHLPLEVNGRQPSGTWRVESIDWFHGRAEILADVAICVPTKELGECEDTRHMLMLGPDDSRILALGRGGAISPMRDQIGFLTSSNAQTLDVDTSATRRITSVPFVTVSIPPFVREETGWSKVVWSPQGDRFWFSTVLDEEFNSSYYLVDLKDGKRRRVLKNTSIDITAWR
jgi:hypothetical protein